MIMRRNMLQTWTPAWLLLTALLMVGTAATGGYRAGANVGREPAEASLFPYCAVAQYVASGPRTEGVSTTHARTAAAMLLVLARRPLIAPR
jgi:hypothetical protein